MSLSAARRGTQPRVSRGALLGPLLALAACQAAAPAAPSCTVQWHSTLPVLMRQTLAVVPARINGEPVGLGVDSGAPNSVVTPELVARLDLRPDPGMSRRRIGGIGGGAYSQVVALDSLQFAGVTYRKIDADAASLGDLGAGTLAVSGLVGEDLLSRYDVGFDIGHREISFYTVRGCAEVSPPWGAADPIPLRLSDQNHLVFPLELDGRRLNAMFDSGAGTSLLLEGGTAKLGLTPDTLARDPVMAGEGIGRRAVSYRRHRFAALRIGGETIADPQIEISDFAESGVDLILGMRYLRDHQVFVSHATARMFVRGNAGMAPLAARHD